MQKARDVVVVPVSEQGDRDEENFHSPKAQLAKPRRMTRPASASAGEHPVQPPA